MAQSNWIPDTLELLIEDGRDVKITTTATSPQFRHSEVIHGKRKTPGRSRSIRAFLAIYLTVFDPRPEIRPENVSFQIQNKRGTWIILDPKYLLKPSVNLETPFCYLIEGHLKDNEAIKCLQAAVLYVIIGRCGGPYMRGGNKYRLWLHRAVRVLYEEDNFRASIKAKRTGLGINFGGDDDINAEGETDAEFDIDAEGETDKDFDMEGDMRLDITGLSTRVTVSTCSLSVGRRSLGIWYWIMLRNGI